MGNLAAPSTGKTGMESRSSSGPNAVDRMRVLGRLLPALVVNLALGAADVRAQGFQVNEHGTCAQGRAGTGVAKSCGDGSAIWFNPALLAGVRGWTVSFGTTLIATTGGFTDDFTGRTTDLDNSPIPVPFFYATYGITEKLTAGFGLYVPYGLGTQWPLDTALSAAELEASGAFAGRFLGYDNDLRSIYLQPTVAYRVADWINVGAGLTYVVGSVGLTQRADLSGFAVPGGGGSTFASLGIPPRTDFANANLDASGATGIGGHFGVSIEPLEGLRIGARYMTQVTLDYDGQVTFDPVPTGITLPPQNPIALVTPGLDPTQPLPLDLVLFSANLFTDGQPLADSTGATSIPMPQQFTLGVAYDVSPRLTLLGDWQWVNWSVFDTLTIDFANDATPDLTLVQNYRNTSALRFGAEYVLNPNWTLRGGYLWHQGASPPETVTPLLPEGKRNEFTGGVGINISPMLRLDLAYQYIAQQKRRGRVVEYPVGTPPDVVINSLNSGLYEFDGHLLGGTITVRF